MRRFVPAIAVLLLFAGCSGDRKEAPASPPQGVAGAPVEGNAVRGESGAPSHAGAPGESVARNSPPEIRGVRFVGGDGRPGNTLGVEAEGFDADGDRVQFEIAWRKNGQPAGNGNRLGVPVKRGDKVVVTITPFDGKDRGNSATLTREITNTPPAIEGQEQFQINGNVVTFHVQASDADGDPLTFSVKDAPAGMSIDRSTGFVRWVPSAGTTGKIPFTVIVSDGKGGESSARFTVTISEQPPAGAR